MAQHLIVICIVTILLWYYYIKSKEHDDKYLPVMVRQSELMHENTKLKQENKKLKMRMKYLENYKKDVSKTFKILDNELVLINEHLKQNRPSNNRVNEQEDNVFRTSVTPNVLNSLLSTSQQPSDGLFNSIFNRFLTGDLNLASQEQEPIQQESNEHQDTQEPTLQTHLQPQSQPQTQQYTEQSQENMDDNDETTQASVSFSVNYLPLNSTYRQYLIRRDDNI